jgi:hypothetical protein
MKTTPLIQDAVEYWPNKRKMPNTMEYAEALFSPGDRGAQVMERYCITDEAFGAVPLYE